MPSSKPSETPPAPNGSDPDWSAISDQAAEADQDDWAESGIAEGGEASSAELTQDQEDQVRKDMMHAAVGFGLTVPNWARQARGKATLKSLDLASYGAPGRAATDQMHDRLMETTWFVKAFGPVNLFAARYGAILALGFAIRQSASAELAEIAEAENAARAEAKPAAEELPPEEKLATPGEGGK